MAQSGCAVAKSLPASAQKVRFRLLPAFIIALVSFIGATCVIGLLSIMSDQTQLSAYNREIVDIRNLATAMIDAQSSARAYLLDHDARSLDRYLAAGRKLAAINPGILQQLDADTSGGKADQADSLQGTFARLWTRWDLAVRLAGAEAPTTTQASRDDHEATALMRTLRGRIDAELASRINAAAAQEAHLASAQLRLLIVVVSLAVIALSAMIFAFHSNDREARGRERSIAESHAAHNQVEQLFFMADMLQSAASQDDTNAVLRATARALLPGLSGAMYVFNNSRDRLDLTTRWGPAATGAGDDHFHPDACWALKRGKPNLNGTAEEGALRCAHAQPGQVSLEIPMAARGQLHGLLEIIAEGEDAEARLQAVRPIAAAIGDAMSLALSSMALRDRLRNQALKDGLTGLYNRRFLEETLERLCLDAERRKSPLSAVMIDLDHFKRLNDMHGHAVGDRVLREVARTITTCLRSTDIACRYGGEELCILLPDCPLEMGTKKAEQVRSRIAELVVEGIAVTASMGVACLPETSGLTDLLTSADAALYLAKQQGRDRVVAAVPRSNPAQRLSVVGGADNEDGAEARLTAVS